MEGSELVNLRDFVYLDVERVKSLLAQLDRGLLTDRTDSMGSSTTLEGSASFSLPALAEVGGAGQYISTDQSSETHTLHDFVYNQTEEKLLERRRIKRLPQDFSSARILSEEVRARLSPVEYVLVRGKVSFSDYQYLTGLLDNANDLMRITTNFAYQERIRAATGQAKSEIEQKKNSEIKSHKLDDRLVHDLKKIFDTFLRDRLVIKVLPFPEDPNIRIVGPLQFDYLRERLENIRFKFGSSPVEEWTVFGQIAAVPQEHEIRVNLDLKYSNQIDLALERMFASLREVEDNFRVTYPEIAITPIAIYRD